MPRSFIPPLKIILQLQKIEAIAAQAANARRTILITKALRTRRLQLALRTPLSAT
jgi:hypothetical protein